MIFVVVFEDNDEQAGMRKAHMDEHLAFLEKNAEKVRAAGPLKDAVTDAPAGGLWLVEATDTTEVQTLIETDPFWPTGLRKSVRILEWRHVFAEGRRQI